MAVPDVAAIVALVPADVDNPTCEELDAIVREGMQHMISYQKHKYNSNGSLTDEFTDMICDLEC